MEAGGIEPPSREGSAIASTYVVESLDFRRRQRQSTNFAVGYSGTYLADAVPDMNFCDPELTTGFQGSPAKPINRDCFFLCSQYQIIFGI